MRQLLALVLSLGALAVFGQTPADSTQTFANKRIAAAEQALQKTKMLVEAGALPRLRLSEAEQDLADAQDKAILDSTLFGDWPAKEMDDAATAEMLGAAQRRLDRGQARLDQTQKLVADGIVASWSLTPLQAEVTLRRTDVDLAQSRSRLLAERAEFAKMEASIARAEDAGRVEDTEFLGQGMEHYEGSGVFEAARDLKPIAVAFALKFDHPLPVSAEGETGLHRALGFDHRGRVDVALDPNDSEGIWLRGYLKSRNIPYYAFTRSIPGKSTAAHIHIGPGSLRLHNAD
jgi:hypothetical protein